MDSNANDKYEQPWRDLRRRRLMMLLGSYGMLGTTLVRFLAPSGVTGTIQLIAFLAGGLLTFHYIRFRCPRCRNAFFNIRRFESCACVHCGLQRGAREASKSD